jgi:flagellar biosynthetic protein FlhB
MSDANGSGDKTEKPSAQKLRKAREEGQTVRSRDLATAIGIVVSFQLFVMLAPGYLDDFRSLFAQGYASLDGRGTLENLWSATFAVALALVVKMMLPWFIVPLAAVIGSLVPGGWAVSLKPLMPDFGRLSPFSNLKRLVAPTHYSELVVSVLKVGVLIAVAVHVSRASIADYLELQSLHLDAALARGAALMIDGIGALCAVFVAFALIDVPVQAFFFLRGQRMSKQEQKEEHKNNEGNPQVRGRIRQLQQQLARRSVRKTVPGADVVIVNPTHYAVALKYDGKRAEAPFVIAKGVDEVALYIRAVALEHGVEVLTLAPLARAVYHTSQVQQQIPMPLYRAVAQVLTYVMQLKAFRDGRRRNEPVLPNDLSVPAHLSDPA